MASVYDINSIQRIAAVPRKKPFEKDAKVVDAVFSPKVRYFLTTHLIETCFLSHSCGSWPLTP